MSSFENDSIYNSSNDDDDIVTNSRFGTSNSSRLPPGLTNQPTIPSQIAVSAGQIMGGRGVPDRYGEIRSEMDLKDSQEQDNLEELGLNLGRRLARLELGNNINAEKLEKIKERCKVKEKAQAMENVRVDDLEGKLISMEARLASEEKQGFEGKEKIERLEKTLKIKEKEISDLKEILSKTDDKRVKEERRLAKLEEGNGQLTKQFLVLLETCETFNDELQSLKSLNTELKRELKKKQENLPPSSGSQTSQHATKPEGTGVEHQKVIGSTVPKSSQNAFKLSKEPADKKANPRKPVNPSHALLNPSGHNIQEFVPQTPGSYSRYYYSGPAGPGAYYYTTKQGQEPGPCYYTAHPQQQLMVYGRPSANGAAVEVFNSADLSGYQNCEYGQN